MKATIISMVTSLLLYMPSASFAQKKTVTLPYGYSVGEVITDNVNIRSGAGTHYPIATYKYMDVYARQAGLPAGEQRVDPAYKGQLMWVKEEGDWYNIDPHLIGTERESPQYIAKRFVKLLESSPFEVSKITSPQLYVGTYEDVDDSGGSQSFMYEIALFPTNKSSELVAVGYFEGMWGDSFKIGTVSDGDAAIKWMRIYDAEHSDDVPAGTKPSFTLTNQGVQIGTGICVKYPDAGKKEIVIKGITVKLIDLTAVPVDTWIKIFKDSQKLEKNSKSKLHYSDFPFLLKDVMERDCVKAN